MSSWNDLINGAFEDIGLTQVGEAVSGSLLSDAQRRFNQFLSSLNTEGLTVFNQVMQVFNLVAGVDSYTLGVGGSWNTATRAQKVKSWRAAWGGMRKGSAPLAMDDFAAAAAAMQVSLAELYTRAVLEGIIAGNPGVLTAPVPTHLGADTAYPLINIRIAPAPSNIPGQVELAYWTPIAQVVDFTATVVAPDGWEEMLRSNFALKLFAVYPREGGIPPELAAAAQNSKASIVSQNNMQAPPPQQQ